MGRRSHWPPRPRPGRVPKPLRSLMESTVESQGEVLVAIMNNLLDFAIARDQLKSFEFLSFEFRVHRSTTRNSQTRNPKPVVLWR